MASDRDGRGAEYHRRVLGIAPRFTEADLKATYRRLIFQWHPDKHSTDARRQAQATEKAKQVNLAYEYLSEILEQDGGQYQGLVDWERHGVEARDAGRADTCPEPRHTYRGRTYRVGFPDPSVTEIFLKSSHIISAGYDRSTRTLYIKFEGDVVYRYEDVPMNIVDAFLNAESHGRYAHRHIYPAYAYKRC
jgi:hypothetical protein